MEYELTALVVQEGDQFAAYCEEFPPTVGRGATVEEAIEALKREMELTFIENRAITHETFKHAHVLKREELKIPRDPFDALR